MWIETQAVNGLLPLKWLQQSHDISVKTNTHDFHLKTHIVPQTWNIIPFVCFIIGQCDCVSALTTRNMIKSHEKNSNITTATSKDTYLTKTICRQWKETVTLKVNYWKGVIYKTFLIYSLSNWFNLINYIHIIYI